jgi:hypothetical protein
LKAKHAHEATLIFAFLLFVPNLHRMPKYGFHGKLQVRCTDEQTATLRRMLERQGVQPATLGRELVAAACRFLDGGGRIEFPLRVVPETYAQSEEPLPMVAEDDPHHRGENGIKPASHRSPGAA